MNVEKINIMKQKMIDQREEETRHVESNLRDHFATAALIGILAGNATCDNHGTTIFGRVEKAYQYADEMLRARKR